ncbi:hypothetical protein C8F04DRAFT_693031, partial [Mycena alexandri]
RTKEILISACKIAKIFTLPPFPQTHPYTTSHTTSHLTTMAFTASDILKIIAAVILPPLGVFLERGCGTDLLINVLLTILGFIPGIIHGMFLLFPTSGRRLTFLLALYIILKY